MNPLAAAAVALNPMAELPPDPPAIVRPVQAPDPMPGFEWRHLPGVGWGWVQKGIVTAPGVAAPVPKAPGSATTPATPARSVVAPSTSSAGSTPTAPIRISAGGTGRSGGTSVCDT